MQTEIVNGNMDYVVIANEVTKALKDNMLNTNNVLLSQIKQFHPRSKADEYFIDFENFVSQLEEKRDEINRFPFNSIPHDKKVKERKELLFKYQGEKILLSEEIIDKLMSIFKEHIERNVFKNVFYTNKTQKEFLKDIIFEIKLDMENKHECSTKEFAFISRWAEFFYQTGYTSFDYNECLSFSFTKENGFQIQKKENDKTVVLFSTENT